LFLTVVQCSQVTVCCKMKLGTLCRIILGVGITLVGLCVIGVWVPILPYTTSNCIDMQYVTLYDSEQQSRQLMCNVTSRRAASIRVQLEIPSQDLYVALVSDGKAADKNNTLVQYKSNDVRLGTKMCYSASYINNDIAKGTPLQFIATHPGTDELCMFVADSSAKFDGKTYTDSDYDSFARKSAVHICASNISTWWNRGGESMYTVFLCNPGSDVIESSLFIKHSVPGFNIERATIKYRDVEDVVIPLDKNASSSVEQHVIVQYKRSPSNYTTFMNSSAVIMDITASDYYKHAALGSYLGVLGLGIVLIVIAAIVLASPSTFVNIFGSRNMRNLPEYRVLDSDV